jgi:hypothetical protein
MPINQALTELSLSPPEPQVVKPDHLVTALLATPDPSLPILVTGEDENLVGIVTMFDLL